VLIAALEGEEIIEFIFEFAPTVLASRVGIRKPPRFRERWKMGAERRCRR
jgi:hypothetical protein